MLCASKKHRRSSTGSPPHKLFEAPQNDLSTDVTPGSRVKAKIVAIEDDKTVLATLQGDALCSVEPSTLMGLSAFDLVKIGQVVDAEVLSIRQQDVTLGLFLQQLEPLCREARQRIARIDPHMTLKGTVLSLSDDACRVQIEPGVIGHCDGDNWQTAKVERHCESLKPGDDVNFKVLRVDEGSKPRVDLEIVSCPMNGKMLSSDIRVGVPDSSNAVRQFVPQNVRHYIDNLSVGARRESRVVGACGLARIGKVVEGENLTEFQMNKQVIKQYFRSVMEELKMHRKKGTWLDGVIARNKEFVGSYVVLREGTGDFPPVVGIIPASSLAFDVELLRLGRQIKVIVDRVEFDSAACRLKLLLLLVPTEFYDGTMRRIVETLVTQDVSKAMELEKSELHACVLVGMDKHLAFLRIQRTRVIGILPIELMPDNVTIGSFLPARVVRLHIERGERCRQLAQKFKPAATEMKFVLMSTKQDPSLLKGLTKEERFQLTDGFRDGWASTKDWLKEQHWHLMKSMCYDELGYKRFCLLEHLRSLRHNPDLQGIAYETNDRHGEVLGSIVDYMVDKEKYEVLTPDFVKHYWDSVASSMKIFDSVDLENIRHRYAAERAELMVYDNIDPMSEQGKLKRLLNGEPMYTTQEIMGLTHLNHDEKVALDRYVKATAVDPIKRLDELIAARRKALDPDVLKWLDWSCRWHQHAIKEIHPPPTYQQHLLRVYYQQLRKTTPRGETPPPFPDDLPLEHQPGLELILKFEGLLKRWLRRRKEEFLQDTDELIPAEALVGASKEIRQMSQGDTPHGIPIPLPGFR